MFNIQIKELFVEGIIIFEINSDIIYQCVGCIGDVYSETIGHNIFYYYRIEKTFRKILKVGKGHLYIKIGLHHFW